MVTAGFSRPNMLAAEMKLYLDFVPQSYMKPVMQAEAGGSNLGHKRSDLGHGPLRTSLTFFFK